MKVPAASKDRPQPLAVIEEAAGDQMDHRMLAPARHLHAHRGVHRHDEHVVDREQTRLHRGLREALFLPAGNIHAYLRGIGIELMASSDNVLRGGLTPKHVDVAELMSVLDFGTGDVLQLVGA